MKNVMLLLITLLTLGFPAKAQESYKMVLTNMVIKGTSNVHKWESKVTQLTGSASLTIVGNQIESIQDAQFEIPVKGIKSSKGNTMDNKTYATLKSDECGLIKFKLTNSKLDESGNSLHLKSAITIACNSKSMDIQCTVKNLGEGQYAVTGSKTMKMSDFGIKPPTALLGTMVTGDEITIVFEVKLSK